MTDGTHEFDLLIKNVRVARPAGDGLEDLDIAIKGGRFSRIAPEIAVERAGETYDARNRIAFSRSCGPAHALRDLRPAGAGCADRKPRRGAGGRDHQPELHAHRPVLPEQGRAVCRVLPGGAGQVGWALSCGLLLSPGADGFHAYLRAAHAGGRAWRDLVQDLHVLRQLWAARRFGQPERLPDDRRGRTLRLRALRVRDARRQARHAGAPRTPPRRSV